MKKKLSGIMILLILGAACNKQTESISEMTMKNYEVDPDKAPNIARALNRLLEAKAVVATITTKDGVKDEVVSTEKAHGRSRLISDGIIAIKSTEKIHAGIPDLLNKIKQAKAIPTEQLDLTYEAWAILPKGTEEIVESGLSKPATGQFEYLGSQCIRQIAFNKSSVITGKVFKTAGGFSIKGQIAPLPNEKDTYLLNHRINGRGFRIEHEVMLSKNKQIFITEQLVKGEQLPKPLFASCGHKKSDSRSLQARIVVTAQLNPKP